MVSVKIKRARVPSVAIRKGEVTITIRASVDDLDAVQADLNAMTHDAFRAEIKITGKQEQTALNLDKIPPQER